MENVWHHNIKEIIYYDVLFYTKNDLHWQAEPSAVGNISPVQVLHTPAVLHLSHPGISQAKTNLNSFII